MVRLRIEDLDTARVRPGMVEACQRDLEWLGLDWDGTPLLQSADVEPLRVAMEELLERGLAYPCVCSRKEILAQLSAPHAEHEELPYPGTCRGRYASVADAEHETGRASGVRFAVEPGPVRFHDEVAGDYESDVSQVVGDFLIARRDAVFAYQLAVVVDDARQDVDEVVRGDDLLPSTPRQLLLQRALHLPHPRWYHLPLVGDAAGRRLAKRRGDLTLRALREFGVDPRAVVAWAARSAGYAGAERILATDLLGEFEMSRVPRHPVRLVGADVERLRASRV